MTGKKILIVDDEADFLESFRRTLEAKAFDVITSTSRSEAQDKMKFKPDLLVLGTMSPAGEAATLHQWLRRHPRYRDLPLVVVDAPPGERYLRGWRRAEGMELEADDYFSKPVEPVLLVPRIQSLLEQVTQLIKLLIADDHTMIRDGLSAVLSLQTDMKVVAEAVDGKDAVEKVLRLVPDVALMDIVMPTMSGIEATKIISKEAPQTKVLILTQYDEDENMLVARRAGALGFIPKRAASAQLLEGIKAVYEGKFFPEGFKESGS